LFSGVKEKLERASYFLNNLKTLADDAGGIAYIKSDKRQEMRANLDAFFFEIISAKDFFLQGINDRYVGLSRRRGTDISELKQQLSDVKAQKVVTKIEKLLGNQRSELWTLNKYRNSATHRELLHVGLEATITLEKAVFNNIQRQGKKVIKIIPEGQEKEVPPDAIKVEIPRDSVKMYLFKDPEDPSQGNMDIEIIPYCEQSLEFMRTLLEKLYFELGI